MAIATLTIDIRAGFAQLSGDLRKVEGNLAQFQSKVGQLANQAKTALAGIGVGLLALDKIHEFRGLLDAAEGLNKLSQRTGIATESLSELRYAANLADVPMEDLTGGIQKLAQKMADVQSGGKEMSEVFDVIGVKVTDGNGKLKKTEDILGEVAAKFAGYEDGANKVALSREIFGKTGDSLIPLLNQLGELRDEGKRFGAVFDSEFAKKAEEFNDGLKRLAAQSERTKVELLGGLIDPLLKYLDVIRAIKAEGIWEWIKRKGNEFGMGVLDRAENDPVTAIVEAERKRADVVAQLAAVEEARNRYGGLIGAAAKVWTAEDVAILKGQIDFFDKQIATLTEAVTRQLGNEPSLAEGPKPKPKVTAPGLPKKGEDTEAEKKIKSLQSELAKTTSGGMKLLEVLNEINSGAIKLDKGKEGPQRDTMLTLATQIDQMKESAEWEKRNEDAIMKKGEALTDALTSYRESVAALELDAAALKEDASWREVEVQMLALEKAGLERGSEAWLNYRDAFRQAVDRKAGVQMMVDTRTELEKQQLEMQRAANLYDAGAIDAEVLARQNAKILGVTKSTTDQVSQWWQQAARSTQSVFADGALAIIEGRMESLPKILQGVLNRMVSQIVAADLGRKLFGDQFEKTGQLGGWIGELLKVGDSNGLYSGMSAAEASQLSLAGFAEGGRPPVGRPSWVGEEGRELFVPDVAGTIIPASQLARAPDASGSPVAVYMTVNTPDVGGFRAAEVNVASGLARSINGAMRRTV